VTGAKDGMHSDGGGLFLRVKGNARAWVFRFTYASRKREMGLGPQSAVSLATARERAAQARDVVSRGDDPIAARTAPQAVTVTRRDDTFEANMRRYIAAHRATWSNGKHASQWESSLRRHAGPLLQMPIGSITTADVEAVLAPIWLSKCETASRVRQRIERILGAAIARGDRPGPNPGGWRDNLSVLLPDQSRVHVVRHHSAVPWRDAPEAFAAVVARRDKGIGYRALITICLTALRSGEVRHLHWSDVGDDMLVLPAVRMKARRAHRVPVTGPLAVHLSSLPRVAGAADLVHPGQSRAAMSDMTISKAMRGAGLGQYTPHGWRSTFSDWANSEGWNRDLIEDQLAHQIGGSVERAYRRSDYLDRRRPLMDAWGKYLVGAS